MGSSFKGAILLFKRNTEVGRAVTYWPVEARAMRKDTEYVVRMMLVNSMARGDQGERSASIRMRT